MENKSYLATFTKNLLPSGHRRKKSHSWTHGWHIQYQYLQADSCHPKNCETAIITRETGIAMQWSGNVCSSEHPSRLRVRGISFYHYCLFNLKNLRISRSEWNYNQIRIAHWGTGAVGLWGARHVLMTREEFASHTTSHTTGQVLNA